MCKHNLLQNAMDITLPPEVETVVQRQITSGKYKTALEVIKAGIELIEQEDIYQRHLEELQQEAKMGWETFPQSSEVVNGATATAKIRANMKSRRLL